MDKTKKPTYRRQIKTTLTEELQVIFDGICSKQKIKESQLARNAISYFIGNIISDEITTQIKEKELFESVKDSLHQLITSHLKLFAIKLQQE